MTEPAAGDSPLWWISFVDPDKSAPPGEQVPGGGGFLGVVIVAADTFALALAVTHALGVNPGGQATILGPLAAGCIAPQWRNRLLTADEADAIPEPM